MTESESLTANNGKELSESSSSSESEGKVSGVGDAEQQSSSASGVETYEGVASDDFAAFAEMTQSRLDALTASSVVVTFALFVCAGILAVGTLVRSIELWNS